MPDAVRWGPDNPHPLFGRKTELVWDGKYDEYGNRRPVDIAGSAMPMQKNRDRGYARSLGHDWGSPRKAIAEFWFLPQAFWCNR